MCRSDTVVSDLIEESIAVKSALLADSAQLSLIERIAECIFDAFRRGNRVIFCGNGGSFSDSLHLAAEFVARFQKDRGPLPGVALGTNSSILTAVGNDYSFDDVFAREIAALGKKGDVFLAISTSGNSKNVLRAVEVAKAIGICVFGMTGQSGGCLGQMVDCLRMPSEKTARIQESHILVGHIICELTEDAWSRKEEPHS
jgi:D-sedoheptulose 7-phosphate isomerase